MQKPHPSSEDIIIIPENEYCASERMTIFVGCIYAYKGLLMIFGAFLAWETRHVSIPALNDSRHVGLSVYNVAIMCICGAAVALVLVDHQDAMFLIIGVFVMFCTTATLWLVFVPKMVELKRNPGGSIDKRIRATLRPMGSKTRRDSNASEMESRMKEVKANNSRYRKTLLDRESELQVLIRRLGNEAKEILDSRTDSITETNRLSVPLLRKEAPSATETSDITSLCSLSSQDQFQSFHHPETQKKKPIVESPKSEVAAPPVVQNGKVTEPTIEVKKEALRKIQTFDEGVANYQTCENRRASKPEVVPPRRCSLKNEPEECAKRRVSVPGQQQQPQQRTPKRKPDHGTHVVAKSELWDTGNQHRCSKRASRVSISTDEDESIMHRSVSERKSGRGQKSPKKEQTENICNQHANKLAHFQSTPNVNSATLRPSSKTKAKQRGDIYNATSESELLDREILPIFQKLLTERNKSQHNIDYSFGRSCPNISIKCDIVEYL